MSDYGILTGVEVIDRLSVDDIVTILDYGWDTQDLKNMLENRDWESIGYLAAWIRECGYGCHGFMVEDDQCITGVYGRCC